MAAVDGVAAAVDGRGQRAASRATRSTRSLVGVSLGHSALAGARDRRSTLAVWRRCGRWRRLASLVAICRAGHGHVDRAARWMGARKTIAPLSEKGAAEKAARLGVDAPGLPIARTVAGNRLLYAELGGRLLRHLGAADGQDHQPGDPVDPGGAGRGAGDLEQARHRRRDPRPARQARTGVGVRSAERSPGSARAWWWNPLSYVTARGHALELADVFALAARDPGARTDAFFDTAGQNLVAQLLLAAACGQPVADPGVPVADPPDRRGAGPDPARRTATRIVAADLQAQINAPEKQRGGVFGTALAMCAFMTNSAAMQWVTPTESAERSRRRVDEFDPYEFRGAATDAQTLYSLSQGGQGSARPAGDRADDRGVRGGRGASPSARRGGRLPVPMVARAGRGRERLPVAQAARTCTRHYGSRGICLMTILQSWSQGVEVWGREGMSKLWSAATVKVYGGGVSEVEFLENVSQADRRLRSAAAANVSFAGRAGPVHEPVDAARADPRRRRARRAAARAGSS